MSTFFVEYFEEDGIFHSSFEYQTLESKTYEELMQQIHSYFKDKYGSDTIVNIAKGVSEND